MTFYARAHLSAGGCSWTLVTINGMKAYLRLAGRDESYCLISNKQLNILRCITGIAMSVLKKSGDIVYFHKAPFLCFSLSLFLLEIYSNNTFSISLVILSIFKITILSYLYIIVYLIRSLVWILQIERMHTMCFVVQSVFEETRAKRYKNILPFDRVTRKNRQMLTVIKY